MKSIPSILTVFLFIERTDTLIRRISGLILVLSVSMSMSMAQNHVVYGYVYAFKDLALKNIQVFTKKSNTAVLTDSLGEFRIICAKNDKLTFIGNGFNKVKMGVGKKDSLRVKMFFVENEKSGDIAVGYDHVSKEDLLYSISNYSAYNNPYSVYNNIFDLIQANFSGVKVERTGLGSGSVRLLGISTLHGDPNCLYVVDGNIVADISNIAPLNVETIDILKGSSASIYGSRGANGVVIIKTK